MNSDIHLSQSSVRSASYNSTTTRANNNISQYSSSSYFRRIKNSVTKNFSCDGTRFSSSCFKCFRYFTPTKYKPQLISSPPPPLPAIYNSSQITYSPQYPYSFTSSYINSNNNNNTLDVQAFYTSLPLNQFSTNNQFIFTSNKNLANVCHTPSTTSSLSSFDEPPPVKPRLSLRPQLPPPPPPPVPPPLFVPTIPSMPPLRGPTRPAPKPPIQIKTEQQQANQLLIDEQVDKTDINIVQRRRQHAISELLSTERDYLRDLELLHETFLGSNAISCPDSINKKLLFGNINDINDVSHRLLNLLEFECSKSQQNDDAHCCIGLVFNGLIDQLKHAYAEYCRNHEWVHGYLRKCGNDEKLQKYLQDGLCKLRLQKPSVFDVSALLLRPIQRIVRYPLILNELFKVFLHLVFLIKKTKINLVFFPCILFHGRTLVAIISIIYI
ncbi:unnamed protein product [Rotaria magnacalcarata]|uniref:DH domain-containing protein n=1 Tax=Rotaria magnacalcarata TaxID=392030 RepID=A0A819KZD6_9BILA|nr:unnamed protein product [Rotaria magnacalcarata]